MTWVTLKGRWTRLKGIIEERLGYITYDDLEIMIGRHHQLIGSLQESYGITKEEALMQSLEVLAVIVFNEANDFGVNKRGEQRDGTNTRGTRPVKVNVSPPAAFSQVVGFVRRENLILQK